MSLYGGSHNTFQPAAEYGGSSGNFSYYVLSSYKENDLGIESPDGSANPLHDHTTQGQAFGYFENIINSENRLSLIVGLSNDHFEIPNRAGCSPGSAGLRASTDRANFSATIWMRTSTSSPNTRSSAGSTPRARLTGRPPSRCATRVCTSLRT